MIETSPIPRFQKKNYTFRSMYFDESLEIQTTYLHVLVGTVTYSDTTTTKKTFTVLTKTNDKFSTMFIWFGLLAPLEWSNTHSKRSYDRVDSERTMLEFIESINHKRKTANDVCNFKIHILKYAVWIDKHKILCICWMSDVCAKDKGRERERWKKKKKTAVYMCENVCIGCCFIVVFCYVG